MIITPTYKYILDDRVVITSKDHIDTTSNIISVQPLLCITASEGKKLTNGIKTGNSLFVTSIDGWYEIDTPHFDID